VALRPLNIAPLIVREASWLDSFGCGEIFTADVIVTQSSAQVSSAVSPLYRQPIGQNECGFAPIVAVDIPRAPMPTLSARTDGN